MINNQHLNTELSRLVFNVPEANQESLEGKSMDNMEWAKWALEYLSKLRSEIHNSLNDIMNEVRDNATHRSAPWYATCKNITPNLYHLSLDFVRDVNIPGEIYSSPTDFECQLCDYKALLIDMKQQLEDAAAACSDVDGPPYLVVESSNKVDKILAAVEYVVSKKVDSVTTNTVAGNLDLLTQLARRFHESVLALRKHPHNGSVFEIKNEWDCQYLFRAILASYFPHVKDEEWSPSVGSTSARCEFYIPPLRAMVELKYVRKASDAKKVKAELSEDFVNYGNNSGVDHLVCLVYDPSNAL